MTIENLKKRYLYWFATDPKNVEILNDYQLTLFDRKEFEKDYNIFYDDENAKLRENAKYLEVGESVKIMSTDENGDEDYEILTRVI